MYLSTSRAATLKIDEEAIRFVDEMVELGLAKSRNQALVELITLGIGRTKKLVDRKRKAKEIVERFKREGIPYVLLTAKDVEENRE